MEDMKKTFAKRLKDARKEKGVSQKELAEKCGSKQNTISTYENEKSGETPSLQLACLIADALGVPIGWLCGYDEDSRNITGYQWLVYLDDLLNNPPAIQNKSLISLDDSLNNTVALMFSNDEMMAFFQKYKAIQEFREIDIDLYKAARKKLFEKYGFLFQAGYQMTMTGTPVCHPPIF